MKVNIIPSSIVENPNAGNSATIIVPGAFEISFKINGAVPEFLFKDENIAMVRWDADLNYAEGFIMASEIPENIKNIPGIEIEIKRDHEVIHGLPQAAYFYEYENVPLQCDECKSNVMLNDITEDCNDDGCFTICPVCKSADSFEYIEYQKISEVIN